MKKIIRLFVSFVLMIFLVQIVNAANVGIVVEFPDGSVKTDCVSDAASGYDILQKSTFDVTWSDPGLYGRALCKIDGVGDEVSEFAGNCVWDPDYFWAFYILDGANWGFAPVGAGSYTVVDKDVLGFVRSTGTDEPALRTYLQVCEWGEMNVKDIKVYVDGKKESGADEDGGKIDVIPGSELELKITVENLYADGADIKIEGITVEGVLEGIDDDNDLKDEANDFNLNPERDKEVSLKFNIPLEVEEDSYDLIITIEGENENGFSYSEEIEFEVEVDKEKHDIIFNKLKFLNDNIECGSSASLEVEVVNLGVNDENVKLEISSKDLGINIQESFELSEDPFDKDNSFSKTYNIKLPNNVNPGTYVLFADLFYREEIKSSTVELNIKCNNLIEESSEEIKYAINNPAAQKNNNPPQSALEALSANNVVEKTSIKEEKIPNKDILMAGVFVGEIILLIGGVILLLHLLKKS